MARKKVAMSKDDFIKCEIKRLSKLFDNLPPDAAAVAAKLIENAAFMAVSLSDLQKTINEKGYVEEYQNGEHQSGTKRASEVDIYNTMIKNFNTTMKQLIDLLPDSAAAGSNKNAALEYINGHGRP